MYTTIPVPHIIWEEKNMKYIFYSLPLIGIILGLTEYLLYILSFCDSSMIFEFIAGQNVSPIHTDFSLYQAT